MKTQPLKRIGRTVLPLLVILTTLGFILLLDKPNLYGEINFQNYQNSRRGMERYVDRAEEAEHRADWDAIVDSGRESLLAEWEADAEAKLRDKIVEEELTEEEILELENSMESAKANWESEAAAHMAEAVGSWSARRLELTSGTLTEEMKEKLEEAFAEGRALAENADYYEKMLQWDSVVDVAITEVNTEWEILFSAEYEQLQDIRDEILNVAEREAFEAEIEKLKKQVAEEFTLQRDYEVAGQRNRYFAETYYDNNSLRSESEATGATGVTEDIIARTEAELAEEESNILNRSTDPALPETSFNGEVEDLDTEIKALIDRGLKKWEDAQKELLTEMTRWRESSQQAYETGEEEWERAYRALVEAKENWEEKISGEIESALERWQEQEGNLDNSITEAAQSYGQYMENQAGQWADYSNQLKEVLTGGSQAYREAVENIAWLREMAEDYKRVMEQTTPEKGVTGFTEEAGKIYASGKDYSSGDTSHVQDQFILESVYTKSVAEKDNIETALANGMTDVFVVDDENLELAEVRNLTYKDYSYEVVTGAEPIITYVENNGVREVESIKESYSIKITLSGTYDKRLYTGVSSIGCVAAGNVYYVKENFSKTYEIPVVGRVITADQLEASHSSVKGYWFYLNEIERWEKIKSDLEDIVTGAESDVHDTNMAGENEGAGYLVNEEGNYGLKYDAETGELVKEPYLMTEAELEYETALREKEYYENQLKVAMAVLSYAEPENGVRESGEETERKLAEAELALYGGVDINGNPVEGAKEKYENALLAVDEIVEAMTLLQSTGGGGESIAELKAELELADLAREEARVEYNKYKEYIIIAKNPESKELIEAEKARAEDSLKEIEENLAGKREEYYRELLRAEEADRSGNLAELFEREYNNLQTIEKSESRLENIFNQNLGGKTESELNIEEIKTAIETEKENIWQSEAEQQRYENLLALYNSYSGATGEEKETLRETYIEAIRTEYNYYKREKALAEAKVERLLDSNYSRETFEEDIAGAYGEEIEAEYLPLYEKVAEQNRATIEKLLEQVESTPDGTEIETALSSMKLTLETELNQQIYNYTGDNIEYLTLRSGIDYLEGKLTSLDFSNLSDLKEYLQKEKTLAEEMVNLYSNYGDFIPEDIIAAADGGDQLKQNLLREYYTPLSQLSSYEYISRYDRALENMLYQRDRLISFTGENETILAMGESKITDYKTDMIEYLTNLTGEEIDGSGIDLDFTTEEIENIGSGDFTGITESRIKDLAHGVSLYVNSLTEKGIVVESSLREMSQNLENISGQYNLYDEVIKTVTEEDYQEKSIHQLKADYDSIEEELITGTIAGEFISAIESIIYSEVTVDRKLEMITELYDSLDDSTKEYLINENLNSDYTIELMNSIESLASSHREMTIDGLVAGYMDEGNILTAVEDYISFYGTDLTEEEKTTLKDRLKLYNEKNLVLSSSLTGSLADYVNNLVDDEKISASYRDEMEEYVAVNTYENYITTGLPTLAALPDEFKEYGFYKGFEDYIKDKKEQYQSAPDRETFLSQLINNFITERIDYADSNRMGDYIAFGEKYFSGEIISEVYLPEEVQSYMACKDYYEGYISESGRIYSEDDLATLISDYSSQGFDSNLTTNLEDYIHGLMTVDRYYGMDMDEYGENLTETDRNNLLEYYLLEGSGYEKDLLMPDYYIGVSSLEESIDLDIFTGITMAGYEISKLAEFSTLAYNEQRDNYQNISTELTLSKMLLDYRESPESFVSHRNFLSKESDTTLKVADEDNFMDSTTTHYYRTADGNGSQLQSLKLEELNLLGKELTLFFSTASLVGGAETAAPITTSSLMNDLQTTLNEGLSETEKEAEIDRLISSAKDNKTTSGRNSLTGLKTAVDSLSAMAVENKNLIAQKGDELRLFEEGQNSTLAGYNQQLEEAAAEHRAREEEYNEILSELDSINAEYNLKETEYADAMKNVSDSYKAYKDVYHAYEKAHAVWEYGNSPYLMESEGGAVETGENDGLVKPDARDYYNSVLYEYNIAKGNFESAESDLNIEIAALADAGGNIGEYLNNSAPEYLQKREEFETSGELYNRLGKTIEVVKKDFENLTTLITEAETDYIESKNELIYSSGMFDTENLTEEELNFLNELLTFLSKDDTEVQNFLDLLYDNIELSVQRIEKAGLENLTDQDYELPVNHEYYTVMEDGVEVEYVRRFQMTTSHSSEPVKEIIEDGLKLTDLEDYRDWRESIESRIAQSSSTIATYVSNLNREGELRAFVKRLIDDDLLSVNKIVSLRDAENSVENNYERYVTEKAAYEEYVILYDSGQVSSSARPNSYLMDSAERAYESARKTYAIRLGMGADISDRTSYVKSNGDVNLTTLDGAGIAGMFGVVNNNYEVLTSREDNLKEVDSAESLELLVDRLKDSKYSFDSEELKTFLDALTDGTIDGSSLENADGTYSLLNSTDFLVNLIRERYTVAKGDYINYVSENISTGNMDRTMALRDMENSGWNLLKDGSTFTEDRFNLRTYEGYGASLDTLVNDFDNLIISDYLNQNGALQQQELELTIRSFENSKSRWIDTVSYIKSRGEKSWNDSLNKFINSWRQWRTDTEKAIHEGEQQWQLTMENFVNEASQWQKEAGEVSSAAGLANLQDSMTSKIDNYVNSVSTKLPEGVNIDMDSQRIVSEALNNMPATLGALTNSASSVNVTAGVSEFFNLGIDGQLKSNFDSLMGDFNERMELMTNLKMTDVLMEIVDNFNKSLEENNSSMKDQVYNNVKNNFDAPFSYSKGENLWSIRVVKSATMFNTSYKTIYVDGYDNYLTDHVSLKPLKGVNGEIDFLDVNSFKDIDADELKIYVDLEQEFLYKRIEDVMGTDGKYTEHAGNEMTRLFGGKMKSRSLDGNLVAASSDTDGEIINAYTDYVVGEAEADGNWYSKEIGPGLPSTRVVAQVAGTIVASYFAGPWGAMAVNSLFSAVDVADGTLELKHALVQAGVSAVGSFAGGALGTGALSSSLISQGTSTAFSGIDYEEGGGIGWSNDNFTAGVKSGLVNMAITAATHSDNASMWQKAGSSFASSYAGTAFDYSSDGFKIGWNEGAGERALVAGAAGAAATTASSYAGLSDVNAKPAKDFDYSNSFTTGGYLDKMMTNTIESGAMSFYDMARHDLSWSDSSKQNGFYSGMIYQTGDIGGFLGDRASVYLKNSIIMDKMNNRNSTPMNTEDPLQKTEDNINALGYGVDETTSFMDKLTNMIAYGTYGGDDQIGVNQRFKAEAGAANYFNDAEAGARLAEQVRYMSSSSDGEAASIVKDFNKDTRSETDARLAALAKSGFDINGSGLVNSVATMRKADKMAKEMKNLEALKEMQMVAYGDPLPLSTMIVNGNNAQWNNLEQITISEIERQNRILGATVMDADSYELNGNSTGNANSVQSITEANIERVKQSSDTIATLLAGFGGNANSIKSAINSVANYAREVNSVIDYSNISDPLQYFKDNQDFVKGTAAGFMANTYNGVVGMADMFSTISNYASGSYIMDELTNNKSSAFNNAYIKSTEDLWNGLVNASAYFNPSMAGVKDNLLMGDSNRAMAVGFKTGEYTGVVTDAAFGLIGAFKGVSSFSNLVAKNGGLKNTLKTGWKSFTGYGDEVATNTQYLNASPGSINIMDESDDFFINISKRADVDPGGKLDVIGHGSSNSIRIGLIDGNHRVLTQIIERNPQFKGQDIRLLSCETGMSPSGFAQDLANKLGVRVHAPDSFLWANPDGTYYVADALKNKFGRYLYNDNGSLMPNLNKRGLMRVFVPYKK